MSDFDQFPGFPYQSQFLGNDPYGNPMFDRAVDSVFYRDFWKQYFTNGVFPNPSTGLQVVVNGDLSVKVMAGTCHIQGTTNTLIQDATLTLPDANNINNTSYYVCVRADFDSNRQANLVYKLVNEGLTRTSSIWEIALARVVVRSSATEISQSDISDLRFDTEVCGIVTGAIKSVDTTTLFAQLETFIQEQMDSYDQIQVDEQQIWRNQTQVQQTVWAAWFETIKNDLALAVPFNMDNPAVYVGNTKLTSFEDGVSETLKSTENNILVARRNTVFNENGSITTNTITYDEEEEILNNSRIITIFNTDGTIAETIDNIL